MIIEINPKQLDNLKLFLLRIRLEGDLPQQLTEAAAFNELIEILNNPQEKNGNKPTKGNR